MSVIETGGGARVSRRRALALGAAALAAAALAACGGSSATETPKSGAAATVAPLASQSPGGLVATAQAIASAVPGGAAAVASQVPGGAPVASQTPAAASAVATVRPSTAASPAANTATARPSTAASPAANTSDVASRNNKYKAPPPLTVDKSKKYTATITTNKGTMKAELFVDTAPNTVNNFVFLANDHFYDGVIFHRIVAGFVIQGGDPTGTGTGGPGYKFADEPSSFTKNYEKGTLAMANSGKDTNGSQFFICVDNLTAKGALPKQYNIFGKVTEGMDVVDSMVKVPLLPGGDGARSKPADPITINKVTIETT